MNSSICAGRPLDEGVFLLRFQDEEQVVHFLIHLVDTVQVPLVDVPWWSMRKRQTCLSHFSTKVLCFCSLLPSQACHSPLHTNYGSPSYHVLKHKSTRSICTAPRGWTLRAPLPCSSIALLTLRQLELALGSRGCAVPLGSCPISSWNWSKGSTLFKFILSGVTKVFDL